MIKNIRKNAFIFVILMGLISLFSDATYEGARSITGPFLKNLGASALVVGLVAGFGEFVGYALRLLFGYVADRTKRYWTLTMAGYTVNLLSVPVLALVNQWSVAVALIVAERMGKAIRTPSRDAMLSYAGCEVGRGLTFGIHEASDQLGAIAGPLLIAWVLAHGGTYSFSFAFLAIPALIALAILIVARFVYPTPQDFEVSLTPDLTTTALPRNYKLYLLATAFVAAGYADFPLIAYHIEHESLSKPSWIPGIYAIAMGVDAVAAVILGRLFDKKGFSVLFIPLILSMFFPILAFSNSFHLVILAMILWGIGMGAQESIIRAAVATMVSPERRATAYGIFNTVFGVSWFAGSFLMGFLYEISLPTLITFSVLAQAAALPVLWIIVRTKRIESSH